MSISVHATKKAAHVANYFPSLFTCWLVATARGPICTMPFLSNLADTKPTILLFPLSSLRIMYDFPFNLLMSWIPDPENSCNQCMNLDSQVSSCCTWITFPGERVAFCLPVLCGSAWILHNYVLQTLLPVSPVMKTMSEISPGILHNFMYSIFESSKDNAALEQ